MGEVDPTFLFIKFTLSYFFVVVHDCCTNLSVVYMDFVSFLTFVLIFTR